MIILLLFGIALIAVSAGLAVRPRASNSSRPTGRRSTRSPRWSSRARSKNCSRPSGPSSASLIG